MFYKLPKTIFWHLPIRILKILWQIFELFIGFIIVIFVGVPKSESSP